jgi:threonine/homoserine/homoserine lactone efflux protein
MPGVETLAKWGAIVFLVLAILGFLYLRWESLVKGLATYRANNKRLKKAAAAEKRRAKARAARTTRADLMRIAKRKSRSAHRPPRSRS